ncbi:kazrin-like isoform X2 [Mercenaria mercenaria]|uniref:kazrin-like isoform X2 n=1 Tax=Mercenaria mercenaria TaxID=6596 RepID=UPI00234E7B23|nr:kazrin-like isoform X2 [Mercenaria mercenaria]
MSSMENIAEGLLISDTARQKFSAAVDKQNLIAQTAIQSLDSLNDQIVQFIFHGDVRHDDDVEHDKDLGPKEQETLHTSMVLIRRLLHDAQAKFRKMVEDNKQLAAKIDGSISAANQEVSALRAELEDTNKRLSELSENESTKIENGIHIEDAETQYNSRQKADEENELKRLKEENQRLEGAVRTLTRDISELRSLKVVNSDHPSYGELKLDLIQTKQDLNRAKEALAALKADRKRLKGEKLELLNQMKQLYGTLEDKESELRDFIRNYEQRMRESDDTIKQLCAEKEHCDREKWEIIQKARHAAEQAVFLQTHSEEREKHIQKLELELTEDQITQSRLYTLDLPSTPKSMDSHTPTSDDLPPYDTPPPSANDSSKEDCFHVPTSTPKIGNKHDRDNSFTPLNQFLDNNNDMTDNDKSRDSLDTSLEQRKKKRISLGSISKVFSRGKTRRSLAMPSQETDELPANTRITLLNPENYQEKLKIVDQLKSSHMSTWKANQVLAWLEIVLNMPMYGKKCATNIKSGKVLLGMSDNDLASALEIKHPLHKKKLRLAIEEQRNIVVGTCPKCSMLDHSWVAHKWLHDIGLPQFSPVFESNLVDGRMLNNLTRKDMEKHLEVHRKFHQSSILHAVQLLRKLGFDKEVLAQRRSDCDKSFTDPLVWTNQRVIEWIQNIDLEEFADSLKESGVHGALIVLEPTFTADSLASCLRIPPSKLYIRRHLQTELETLVKPAREEIVLKRATLGRSSRHSSLSTSHSKSRISLRGSLGRAFGKKVKEEMMNSKMSLEAELDSPKQKRTSAPIVVDGDDIPEQIIELDKAIEQAAS